MARTLRRCANWLRVGVRGGFQLGGARIDFRGKQFLYTFQAYGDFPWGSLGHVRAGTKSWPSHVGGYSGNRVFHWVARVLLSLTYAPDGGGGGGRVLTYFVVSGILLFAPTVVARSERAELGIPSRKSVPDKERTGLVGNWD